MATVFKIGARGSALSLAQTRVAVRRLRQMFPDTRWRIVPMASPGDRDQTTPLEKSAPDFFTRDLDEAVRRGKIDCAVHSAKDLPGYSGAGGDMVTEGLDWFWLPEREDPRDCWVFRAGQEIKGFKGLNGFKGLKGEKDFNGFKGLKGFNGLKIGISSARRRAFARKAFPRAKLLPIRGTIDSRIRQMLEGRYDALLMALAGLKRLFKVSGDTFRLDGQTVRLVPISVEELSPPEAQGVLAVTFRTGDARFAEMRSHVVKAVRFVSAGVGDAGFCTLMGLNDIVSADVGLYDDLMGSMDDVKAQFPPRGANRPLPVFMPVGKRCGAHSMRQADITRLICDEARKGRRVVRLKGGDAGLFGRLAEETDALAALAIPFVVRPGVSALTAATTGTGMLLTRRGVSRGFTALTPRSSGADTPLVLFMAIRVAAEEAQKLIAAGQSPQTPCAIVFDAAGPREEIWQGSLRDLAKGVKGFKGIKGLKDDRPGLVIVGEAATHLWPKLGPLAGRRVLLTCSAAIQPQARLAIEDRGGRPIPWPMIELRARSLPEIEACGYGAIVLTSPSAVRIFFQSCPADRRKLPLFFTCGAGTDAELRRHGVSSDLMPESDFSANGLIKAIKGFSGFKGFNGLSGLSGFNGLSGLNGFNGLNGLKVLRLRSAKAGSAVADALRAVGAQVDDFILYDNVAVAHADPLPPFDAVHFASASAVEAFVAAYGVSSLRGKDVFVMGEPTRAALPPRLRPHARRLVF